MLVPLTYENNRTRSVAFVTANGILVTSGVLDKGDHNFSPSGHVEEITPTSGVLRINGRLINRWEKFTSTIGGDLVIQAKAEPVSYLCVYPFRKVPEVFLSGVGILEVPDEIRPTLLRKLGGKNLGELVQMSGSDVFVALGRDHEAAAQVSKALGEMDMNFNMELVQMFLWTPPKK